MEMDNDLDDSQLCTEWFLAHVCIQVGYFQESNYNRARYTQYHLSAFPKPRHGSAGQESQSSMLS